MDDRDTFAAAALTGLLAAPTDKDRSSEYWARFSYEVAGAMLRLRSGAPEDCETVRCTLTDEEREAVLNAARAYELDRDEEECAEIAATLRKLLERLK